MAQTTSTRKDRAMQLFILCATTLFLLFSCSGPVDRQEIDLSDQVVAQPVDGVGHYVYAMSIPKEVAVGTKLDAQMEWRTVGSVDPNARYTMDIQFSGPDNKIYSYPSGANTVGELHLANWLSYDLLIPPDFTPGAYTFGVRLRDSNRDFEAVPLGYRTDLLGTDGFYTLAEFAVTPAE
ncbi:hypothetical protein LEM8419_01311 [Neolewinella maritima]|uniref:DUF4832 domain-containing protein n=2 Tax=Neolewinella maritima TaxID=1383882 RepID=A0ABM9AZH8_9BACT|nr:hypothetical protein LEM8419_01311 [Neolewinella maritima]